MSTRRLRQGRARAAPGARAEAEAAGVDPIFRRLTVYAFDPSRGHRDGNHLELRIPHEPLRPGPVGRRVAVLDQGLDGAPLYPPVDLDIRGAVAPHDSDPAFHQQMVYAVTCHVLGEFDRALGREVRFRRHRGDPSPLLRLLPHGLGEANAHYDRERVRVVFGRFPSERATTGRSIPGRPVYACLSHGIIVHEAAHAVLDGLREDYLRETNADSGAFHEAFADLVAYLHHLGFPAVVLATIERTGGRLQAASFAPRWEDGAAGPREPNPLLVLGEQFAQAAGLGTAIRSAVGRPPGADALEATAEPHARGAVMVAAVIDAFFRVYAARTRGLFRLAGRSRDSADDLHPDLARRLADDAARLAGRFLTLCIRAVAYCPPADVTLGDFLRALLTVHARLDRDDPDGVRDALIDAFAERGIYPPGVDSMSESELLWRGPRAPLALDRPVARALRRADAAATRDATAEAGLLRFCARHRSALGLVGDLPIALRPGPLAIRFAGAEVHVGEELVCQVLQGGDDGDGHPLLGGATLVFGDDGGDAPLRYAITKCLDERRRGEQRRWHAGARAPGGGGARSGRARTSS